VKPHTASSKKSELPLELKSLFWDCDFATVNMEEHHNFIIRRILDRGDWDNITWLRHNLGDAAIRDWFLSKAGGGLDPRKLRFWGLILDLPEQSVDEWVNKAHMSVWHGRSSK
jgi:hypothetical protein